MPVEWTLSVEPQGRPGAQNMATDEALLHDAASSGRAFLRLYRWSPPCLSFGRNEPALARYDRAEIARRGWDVVRRPTGGRAVWHEHEVTYAVAAPVAAFGSLQQSYRAIHERLATALRAIGVAAELAPSNGRPAGVGAGACFASPVGGEVTVRGCKVVGSAQVRRGSALLQHGSILLSGSQEEIGAVSRPPSAISSATSLSHVLGRAVTFAEVVDAVVAIWAAACTAAAPYRLSPSSTATDVDRPLPPFSVFSDPAWTWRR